MPKITVTNLLTGPFEIADPSGLPGADGTVFTLHLDESGHAGGTDTKSKSATKEQLERLAPALDAAQTASKITWSWADDTSDSADDERHPTRVGTASPIVMTVKDEIIICKKSPAGATAVTLPPSPPVGMVVEVIDGNGDAGANNITVSPAAGTVNGGASMVIASNFGRARFTRYATEWLGVLIAPAGAPTGAAGGDLGGNYPNPTVTATHLAAALPRAQGGTGVTTYVIADPGTGVAIPVTAEGVVDLVVGAGAETNTLADPSYEGQWMHLSCNTNGGGTRTVTAAHGINVAGNTHMAFSAAGQNLVLRAVTTGGGLRWRVSGNDGVVLS